MTQLATAPAIDSQLNTSSATVFSSVRDLVLPKPDLPDGLALNKRLKMDGLDFLGKLPDASFVVAFFDPQYRGILDKMNYGNEGEQRGKARSGLPQMSEKLIAKFIREIDRVLVENGHLFLWMDKFHLCQGFNSWFDGTVLDIVDLLTCNKMRIGMGYRTRRASEYLVVLQKFPRRAKGVWKVHNIPDVVDEKIVDRNGHTHKKPVELQERLITAVSNEGDIVIDPAAGSFSVMESAINAKRNFLGCDIRVHVDEKR